MPPPVISADGSPKANRQAFFLSDLLVQNVQASALHAAQFFLAAHEIIWHEEPNSAQSSIHCIEKMTATYNQHGGEFQCYCLQLAGQTAMPDLLKLLTNL
jgi:phosphoheptose isomerase